MSKEEKGLMYIIIITFPALQCMRMGWFLTSTEKHKTFIKDIIKQQQLKKRQCWVLEYLPTKTLRASKTVSFGIRVGGSCNIINSSVLIKRNQQWLKNQQETKTHRFAFDSKLEKLNVVSLKKLEILLSVWLRTKIAVLVNQQRKGTIFISSIVNKNN